MRRCPMPDRRLTAAQRRVIDNDDVAWIGWDTKNRPVIFVIAPLCALAVDRPLFGNWIWHIDLETVRDHE